MNSDFARIMALLRKEKKISQKQAASDLGISQGLLSHYEKGKRECGLDFLVKAADYYGVSCDYLLGRSPEPEGKVISVDELPGDDPNHRDKVTPGTMMIAFNKKLVVNSLNVLFSLLGKFRSATVIKEVSSYLMLAVYKCFRYVYSANPKNDQKFFTIDETLAKSSCDAAMNIAEAKLNASLKGVATPGEDAVSEDQTPEITTQSLSEEFPQYYSSTVNLIKNSEARIKEVSE
ncbi:MAG: helix-turn-helix domain-containing protein [Oscillospiraceae bacterium]|nr:helix-turn-helix domain-containing protein [Ruminococcus sp.]MCD8345925.1 helix-turn-helix domain-containing protein [Oscillospiraceae bacterium]